MGLKLSKYIILFGFFSLLSLTNYAQLFAELEIGIIEDKDGYTFIREGKTTNSKILDTIWEGEFFQYNLVDTCDWYKVNKMWNSSGFVHKSRIKNIESFTRQEQAHLIDSIFKQEFLCYTNQYGFRPSKSKFTFSSYHEEKFVPILELFITYLKQEYDSVLFNAFLQIIILEDKSADELPSWALGEIFLAYPEIVVKEVLKYNNKSLNNDLIFGVSNVTDDFYDELNDKKSEYDKLKEILKDIIN